MASTDERPSLVIGLDLNVTDATWVSSDQFADGARLPLFGSFIFLLLGLAGVAQLFLASTVIVSLHSETVPSTET